MTTTILTDEQKAEFVTDITDYGTDFVAPLFAVVESIEQAVLQSPEVQALRKDAERLEWLTGEECQIQFTFRPGNVIKYRLGWPDLGEAQSEWFATARDAIDAAMEKQP